MKKLIAFCCLFLLALVAQIGCNQSNSTEKQACPATGKGTIKTENLACVYHENGKLKGELPSKNGQIDGLVRRYHENGKIKEEVLFKDGKPEGLAKTYDEHGNLED